MKRIISVVASIILLLNMSLAYTTQITINGSGLITTSEEGNNVRIIPKVGIEGWVVEEGDVELNEEANFTASFTMPSENVVISNLILGVNSPNTLAAGDTWYTKGGTDIAKSKITSIEIKDSYTPQTTPIDSWDASVMDDGTVTVYLEDLGGDTYKLILAGNGTGKIYANINSSSAFKGFANVVTINGFKDSSNNVIFDTNNVTNMYTMFEGCSSLASLDLSGFDTSNVTNMEGMFGGGCSSLTSINLSGFDTSNVMNMQGMFFGCSSLTSLDFSGFDTSNVTNMAYMFGSSGLTNLDLSGFNTSNVITMKCMFQSCGNLQGLDVSKFDTSNVTDMEGMFSYCSALTALDVSKFDTSNVTDMESMFGYCSGLTTLDVSGFNTSKVTDMRWMFDCCTGITALDVDEFDTNEVTEMRGMFYNCNRLSSIDVSDFDTSKVTDMGWMFMFCENLTSIDLSSFDTRMIASSGTITGDDGVIYGIGLTGMLRGCTSLTEIILGEYFGQNYNMPDEAGMLTGLAHNLSNTVTTVTNANEVVKAYDWSTDNRTVTFEN